MHTADGIFNFEYALGRVGKCKVANINRHTLEGSSIYTSPAATTFLFGHL